MVQDWLPNFPKSNSICIYPCSTIPLKCDEGLISQSNDHKININFIGWFVNLVLWNIFMKIMVINDKHIYLLHTSLQLLKVFPSDISKQLCPSHHTFGNDKIKFDQHVWINLPWSFVAFCLSLWMWACSINNKSWSSPP